MSYKEGIVKAITELKDRTGSSMQAIKKHMLADMGDKKWMNAVFLKALKSGVESGDFVQNKNSYKLSAEFKKKLNKKSKPAPKKKAPPASPKKTAASKKKVASPKKKAAPKKKVTAPKKKAAPKKKVAAPKKKV